jgi:hypothetical protein
MFEFFDCVSVPEPVVAACEVAATNVLAATHSAIVAGAAPAAGAASVSMLSAITSASSNDSIFLGILLVFSIFFSPFIF